MGVREERDGCEGGERWVVREERDGCEGGEGWVWGRRGMGWEQCVF